MLHIREAVGNSVELRADANQRWCLSEALQFGHAVKAAGLEVILTCHKVAALAFCKPKSLTTALQSLHPA